jgi:oligosaccharide repeat unit polymerase
MGKSLYTDIAYTAIYILILLTLYWRHRQHSENKWGIGNMLLLSYVLYPIIGCFWYFNTQSPYRLFITELQFWPFIYLATMLYIAAYPTLQYDKANIQHITPPPMRLLNVFAVIYIICTLMQVPLIIENMSSGLRSIMIDTAAGADMYLESQIEEATYDGAISNIASIIFNIFSPLAFILFFYYLTLERRYKWAEIGFGICILIKCFSSLSNGQRTEVTMSVFNILVAYLALRPMLPARIQRGVRITLICLAIAIAIPFIMLSFSRFGDREGGLTGGLVYYIGEAPYYFNQYALDSEVIRHGDRTCNIFKQLLGMPAPEGIFGVRSAYPDATMDDSIFSTFVGDFVLDFGHVTTAIAFIIFSIIFTRLTRTNAPNTIPFHRLILAYFAMSVCMQGGMYLFNYSFEGNLQIIAIALFYAIFATIYIYQRYRKETIG